jgi:hypothetical protein
MVMAKGYGETVVDLVIEHLKLRAGDPWDDELWPAANIVLLQMAEELRLDRKCIQSSAWGKFNRKKKKQVKND